VAGKRANQVDLAIGQQIRLFRQDAELSQFELAKRIGVSFQQVQEYESGTDRVGVGRLMQMADALDVPIRDFFGGVAARVWNKQQAIQLSRIMTAPHAGEVLRAFSLISNSAIESAIIDVLQMLGRKSRRRKN
jgi:transcriptional regulator with XRE-family HTH domain